MKHYKKLKEHDTVQFTEKSQNRGKIAHVTNVYENGTVVLHSFHGIIANNGVTYTRAILEPQEFDKVMIIKRNHLSVKTTEDRENNNDVMFLT